MGKNPASQFYWGDWLNDVELQSATSATRGIWANALARMWYSRTKGEIIGTPQKLTQTLNCTLTEIGTFLEEAQTLLFCYVSRNDNGEIILRNRRMYREAKDKEFNRLRQERYREKQKNLPENDGEITPPSSSSSSSSKKKDIVENESRPHPPYKKIIDHLNEKARTNFKHDTNETKRLIKARWNQGFRLDTFLSVIDLKCKQWLCDEKMLPYLRPQTLFGTKFESYLNEKKITASKVCPRCHKKTETLVKHDVFRVCPECKERLEGEE